MKKVVNIVLILCVLTVVIFLSSTIISPILIIAEDTTETNPGVDMAAKFSLAGFDWVYPGSSVNAQGQTLHNVHLDNPEDPYGAARDIMQYSYDFSPYLIISINNAAADAIFGDNIVDDIRVNDAYNGYAGNSKVSGSMSRGDAVDTAMAQHGMNIFQIPLQMLYGNISFHFV